MLPLRVLIRAALAGLVAFTVVAVRPPCLDTDGDGVCNADDECLGDDATGDPDADGICTDLDPCLGDNATGDSDADQVCDDRDRCLGLDRSGDSDLDDVCDDRDQCLGDDALGDADGDGSCDDRDRCTGDDRTGDADRDGICNDLDRCIGKDATLDADRDGVCDNLDLCRGEDPQGDSDGDRVCDDEDLCLGDDASGDADGDGICSDRDVCLGQDATGDGDGDGVCDDRDQCLGDDASGDEDYDGICADQDSCLGINHHGDSDGDGLCNDLDPCDDTLVASLDHCTLADPLPYNACRGHARMWEGRHTGFVTCPDGQVNRLFATTGWLPSTYVPPDPPMPLAGDACTTHADCTDGLYGSCERPNYTTVYPAVCMYACGSDDDCGDTEICQPPLSSWFGAMDHGVCIRAYCTDAHDCDSWECGYKRNAVDCGSGLPPGPTLMTCRSAADECRVDDDCDIIRWPSSSSSSRHDVCVGSSSGFHCGTVVNGCGRPMYDVPGVAITGPVQPGAGWTTPIDVSAVDPATRRELAAYWMRIAALEHASVASFARHALELLSLGAPAQLMADVAQAQLDEVAHAELAFGLATAYGGRPVRPGAVAAPPPRRAIEDIFRGVLAEGCIGETVAAAEAALGATRATDPAVAAVYRRIADDETRHAELAWRTARWMLASWPELGAILTELEAHAPTGGVSPGRLAAHGVVDAAELRELRGHVWLEVIEPCLRHAG